MSELFTPQEVADKLKLNVRTIYRWIKSGKIKAKKLGESERDVWRIPASELKRLLGED